jgi:hypothetical protein
MHFRLPDPCAPVVSFTKDYEFKFETCFISWIAGHTLMPTFQQFVLLNAVSLYMALLLYVINDSRKQLNPPLCCIVHRFSVVWFYTGFLLAVAMVAVIWFSLIYTDQSTSNKRYSVTEALVCLFLNTLTNGGFNAIIHLCFNHKRTNLYPSLLCQRVEVLSYKLLLHLTYP